MSKPKGFDFIEAIKAVRPDLADRTTLWSDAPDRLVWPARKDDERGEQRDELMSDDTAAREPKDRRDG